MRGKTDERIKEKWLNKPCLRCGITRRERQKTLLGCSVWGKNYPRHKFI